MPIKIQNKGQDFDPIPAGAHQAVCYGVVDIGTQPSKNPKHGPSRKIILLFELPYERADFGDRKNLPRGVSATYTQSLNSKAILRKDLKSWRGRDFTEEELKGFDPKALIGVNCQLSITQAAATDGSGKVYSNITGIMPLAKGMTKAQQENPTLYFSLDDQDPTKLKLPENMPQWIQQKIHFCEEVVNANGGGSDGSQQEPSPAPGAAGAQENLDEDVPF